MAAKGSSSSAMYQYTEEGLCVCLSGSSAGEYTRVTSVEHASHLLREKKVRPELQHVIGQLAFGVELQSLQPDPNPMNTKWLSDFITEKVDVLKLACADDKLFQDSMDNFRSKMLDHTMTMNTASAMKSKVLGSIDQIAEEYTL